MNIEIDPQGGRIVFSGVTLDLIGFLSLPAFTSFQESNLLVLEKLTERIALLEQNKSPDSQLSVTEIAVIGQEYIFKGGAKITYNGSTIRVVQPNGSIEWDGTTTTKEVKINLERGRAEFVSDTSIYFFPLQSNGSWGTRQALTLAEYQAF